MAQNLKINDKVLVIAGDDKGKEAKSVKIDRAAGKDLEDSGADLFARIRGHGEPQGLSGGAGLGGERHPVAQARHPPGLGRGDVHGELSAFRTRDDAQFGQVDGTVVHDLRLLFLTAAGKDQRGGRKEGNILFHTHYQVMGSVRRDLVSG